ncbi:hypothetical protein [Methanosphaera cuniculi]|uniref:hypothetical protein n=1 Tax=Methanosphaera cuniculi TaxID=1077256 RepID=UPI0026EAEA7C|nr:hypothetical protein [Methanosphaera cuniculi]
MLIISSKILRLLTIIIGALIALVITRLGIYFIYVLMLLGVIVTLITRYKKDAIISSIIYIIIGYLISYPNGVLLNIYIPDVEIPITTSIITNITDQLIGLAIPILIAIIVVGMTSYIISLILNYIRPQSKNNGVIKTVFNNDTPQKEHNSDEYTFKTHDTKQPTKNISKKADKTSRFKKYRKNNHKREVNKKIKSDPISIYKKSKGEK